MEKSHNANEKSKKIFVGGYDSTTKKSVLYNYFSTFGQVEKIISQFNRSKNAKGYCFIKFVNAISAQRVLSTRNHRLNNRTLFCSPVLKGKNLKESLKNMDGRRLFLSGLRKITSRTEIEDYFGQFASIENCYIVQRNDKSTNLAFLTVKDPRDIPKLLDLDVSFHGHKLFIQPYERKNEKTKKPSIQKLTHSHKFSQSQKANHRKNKEQESYQGHPSLQQLHLNNTAHMKYRSEYLQNFKYQNHSNIKRSNQSGVVQPPPFPLRAVGPMVNHSLTPSQNGYFLERRTNVSFQQHFLQEEEGDSMDSSPFDERDHSIMNKREWERLNYRNNFNFQK